MLKRKALIPMAAIMLVSSNMTTFANEVEGNNDNAYKEIKYKVAKVNVNEGLNIRNTPEVKDGNKLYAAPKGTELEILGQEDGWYKVELNNNESGWINSKYVEVDNKLLYVNVDRLNFREESSLYSKVYDVLKEGTQLEFLEDNNEWIKVKYEDKEGYVYRKYVTDTKPVIKNREEAVQQSTKGQVNRASNTAQSAKPQVNSSNNTGQRTKPQTNNSSTQKSSKPQVSEKPSYGNSNKQTSVVNLAYAQLGKPYVWGSEGPNSFDCSGLIRYILKNGAGVNLPRTSKQQSNFGTTISRDQLQPGDLIFSSTDGSGGVSHVGVYVGNGEMIHSPKPGDVVQKTKINTSYWNSTYLWAKRVI